MLLFFDFGRLLWGRRIGPDGPAARLARVLDDFASVELVMIRWAIGPIRVIDDVRGELPELGNHIRHLCHRPMHAHAHPEREITSTLRRMRQLYWVACVHQRQPVDGYVRTTQSSGAPLVLCPNGFDEDAAARLRAALHRVASAEEYVSRDHWSFNRQEEACAS